MGIDYKGYYGIGYEVIESDKINEEDIEDGLGEYLYSEVGDDFKYFQTGSGNYTGEEDSCYIVAKEPFRDGLDLTLTKERVDKELKRLNVEPVGCFGSVGGLYVW